VDIKGRMQGELEVKRFYLDGLKVTYRCPKCYLVHNYDDYLSNPPINKVFDMEFYCDNCEHEWTEAAKLSINLIKKPNLNKKEN